MRAIAACALMLGFGAGTAWAAVPEGGSATVAKELVQVLASRQLNAIAAKDPESGHYVAALSFPEVQLLVVSAAYPNPAVLDDAIARKDYQTVYAALQAPSLREGKLFFQDMGADGLRPDGDGSVDVLYEQGTEQTLFDGKRKARDKFTQAEETYGRLLTVLLAQAKAITE